VIEGAAALREAYRDEGVASKYIEERFREPLGALLHDRQVRALRRALRTGRPRQVLEVAPGPARLTVEIAAELDRPGTIVDASPQMLAVAKTRLGRVTDRPWRFVTGDAFALPFQGPFDLAYSFRLVRHFERADRVRLYREIARVLRPGGLFIFDAVNERVSAPLRAAARAGEYRHHDALLRPDEVVAELREAGLEVVSMEGIQRRYRVLSRVQVLVAPRSRPLARAMMEVVDRLGGEPLEWVVTCRRA
jgi:ubiquinone/menaquinone biosynthesis C-methylase UbiE